MTNKEFREWLRYRKTLARLAGLGYCHSDTLQINDLNGSSNKRTLYRSSPVRLTGKSKTMLNFARPYFNRWGFYESMPSEVEDILIGCCRQSDSLTDNTRVSSRQVFSLLCAIDYIETRAVMTYMNQRRHQTGQSIDERHARSLCAVMRRVCFVMQHHQKLLEDITIRHGVRVQFFDADALQEDIDLCVMSSDPYGDDSLWHDDNRPEKTPKEINKMNGSSYKGVDHLYGEFDPVPGGYVHRVTGELYTWNS